MSNACFIAACAVNSKLREEQDNNYKKYFNKTFDFYYKVRFRKIYYFKPMVLVTPVNSSPHSIMSAYAPAEVDLLVKPVRVAERTIVLARNFPILASQCINGVDNYIKENLKRFTSSSTWVDSDKQVISKYIKELNSTYDIFLDPKSLAYEVKYYWEVT